MKAIVVVDKNWGIGKDNGLLTYLPGDLRYFKEKTLGKVLIMGRKTLESLPGGKALPGRTTIVLTKDENYKAEAGEGGRVIVANSFNAIMTNILMLEMSEGIDIEEDIMVAGGESIYKLFMPYCNEFLVTKIDHAFEPDRYFENLDKLAEGSHLKLAWESDPIEEKGFTYKFTRYERI